MDLLEFHNIYYYPSSLTLTVTQFFKGVWGYCNSFMVKSVETVCPHTTTAYWQVRQPRHVTCITVTDMVYVQDTLHTHC